MGSSYSSKTTFEAVARRLALFERKMRAALPMSDAPEEQWTIWRKKQLSAMLMGKAEGQRRITKLKVWLRNWLPPALFRMVNLLWRHTVGAVMRGLVKLHPRYRKIARGGQAL